jgi:hypothetical protein
MALLGKYARVTCAIRCGGWDAYLGRVAGDGLGVLPGWCGLEGHCDRACGTGHHGGPGWVWRSQSILPVYGHDHRVWVRDELRDNHHGRPRTSVAPGGWLNRAKPRKCAGQGTMVIASGRRGRGFKSRHPDRKTPGQRLCAIEARWSWVTNCVTIGSFFRWCSPDLVAFRRFTVVIVCRSRLRVPRPGRRPRCEADDAHPPGEAQKSAALGAAHLMGAKGRRPTLL